MKKINLVDMVIDFLASDQPSDMISQYHPEIVKKYLEIAFNSLVYQTWLAGKKFSDFSQLDVFTKTYSLQLYNGSLSGTIVSGNIRLPFPPVQLPNNMGIRQVALHTDEDVVFAYLENTAVAIFSELEVSSIDDTPTFRLEMNDSGTGTETHILKCAKIPAIYYLDPDPTYIDIKMIVPLDKIDDYDDVALPTGGEDNLVKQTVEFIRRKPEQDLANDLNATIPSNQG